MNFFAVTDVANFAFTSHLELRCRSNDTTQHFKGARKIAMAKIAIKSKAVPHGYDDVRGSIVELLGAARQSAARHVNGLMTASYWEIGRRIVEAEQKGRRRADYGVQLIARLSIDLTQQFGRGFSADNLENMRRFFLAYPEASISETASRKLDLTDLTQRFKLPWSAYVHLIAVQEEHAWN
jgi:hypothetical protein